MESLLLLGRDFPQKDKVHLAEFAGVTAAISAGASVESPGSSSKIDANEDGLLVLSQGDLTLLAVTDSHFGAECGHELLRRIQGRCRSIPSTFGGLSMLLVGLTDPPQGSTSGATLSVCVLDATGGRGFGLTFGDSDVFAIEAKGARRLSFPNQVYLHLDRPLPMEMAGRFEFDLGEERLLMCSDGITECHYRSPETSIGCSHFAALHAEARSDLEFTAQLAHLALKGVDGNPGGQDNLVILTTRAR